MLLLQPLDLDQRLRLDLLRHAGGFDLLAQLAGQRLFGAGLAQLLLDGAELLAQEVLALLLVHAGLRFGLDLLPQIEHVSRFWIMTLKRRRRSTGSRISSSS